MSFNKSHLIYKGAFLPSKKGGDISRIFDFNFLSSMNLILVCKYYLKNKEGEIYFGFIIKFDLNYLRQGYFNLLTLS